jgi:predicted Zn-dependent protease
MRSLRLALPNVLLAACAAVGGLAACARVEGTNRRQFLITSEAQENALGAQAYQEVLEKGKNANDPVGQAMVERVGRRLAAVAPQRGYQWEFTLIEDPTPNAFCLPGGKVAIHTGILGLCRNEAGLATVMGHEIGHAIARHGGERMSQGTAASIVGSTVAAALQAKGVDPTTQNIATTAFGLGAKYGVILPFSRAHETEADALGIDYLAKAGYEPQEAVAFWTRFAALSGDGGPSFLSTHPKSADRAQTLDKLLPKAKATYEAAPQRHGSGEAVPAKYLSKS